MRRKVEEEEKRSQGPSRPPRPNKEGLQGRQTDRRDSIHTSHRHHHQLTTLNKQRKPHHRPLASSGDQCPASPPPTSTIPPTYIVSRHLISNRYLRTTTTAPATSIFQIRATSSLVSRESIYTSGSSGRLICVPVLSSLLSAIVVNLPWADRDTFNCPSPSPSAPSGKRPLRILRLPKPHGLSKDARLEVSFRLLVIWFDHQSSALLLSATSNRDLTSSSLIGLRLHCNGR